MKALVFGDPPDPAEVAARAGRRRRPAAARHPLRPARDGSTPARAGRTGWSPGPILAGVCGSDAKLVLGDFSEGDMDNPHVGLLVDAQWSRATRWWPRWSSWVPRPRASRSASGWCSTPGSPAPPGASPRCAPPCGRRPDLCWSFTTGELGAGIHIGVITEAPGAWAERAGRPRLDAARRSPTSVSDEAAVLADPFAVSFHAVRAPPPAPGRQGRGLRGRGAGAHLRGHPAGPLPRRGGGGGGPLPGPDGHGRAVRGRRWWCAHEPPLAVVEALADVVGRRPAPAVHRAAGHPARPHRRGLRHRRQGRDLRGLGPRPGRAGHPGLHRGGHAPAMGVDAAVLQRAGDSPAPTPSPSRSSTACASTPSPTTSTSWPTGGST